MGLHIGIKLSGKRMSLLDTGTVLLKYLVNIMKIKFIKNNNLKITKIHLITKPIKKYKYKK